MKKERLVLFLAVLFALVGGVTTAQARDVELNSEVFELINLDAKGLEKVKELHTAGDDAAAAKELLKYFKKRTGVVNPLLDMNNIKASKADIKMADEALEHKFFSHKGYQPSYFYGEDIDWDYWPVQDNELRWQLHRHKWFTPMGKVYVTSGDEKYAEAWVDQYMDWIVKNPLKTQYKRRASIPGADETTEAGVSDNLRFSWRPLEVSHRLQDQCAQFQLYSKSPSFTPEFFTQFLVNYYKHANHIMNNFSSGGNHLLFEAQRVLQAGSFFPEYKEAASWRAKGISILNDEIGKQVYDDGFQYELCPHYHLASIGIFLKALDLADANGFRGDFPASYIETMEKMTEAFYNIMLPDYFIPMFSDNRAHEKRVTLRDFDAWQKLFPENEELAYFASEYKKGTAPSYTSNGFLTAGFFAFRSGWDKNATAMILKAGPPAFWHNQPDNGTFDLYIKGRNFMPDGGCYVYGGDDEVMKWRNWFRQTAVHKTITLDGKDLETTDSKTLLWEVDGDVETLVTENQSYSNLKHRRSVFFVNKEFFVIVDEAMGTAQGNVELNYQFAPTTVTADKKKGALYTEYDDKNNIYLQCDANQKATLEEVEGWISYDYMIKEVRPAYTYTVDKKDDDTVRFVTVILPVKDGKKAPKTKTKVSSDNNEMSVTVTVDKKEYKLDYAL